MIRVQLNWIHNGVTLENYLNSSVAISTGDLHNITLVSNLTRTNIDPSIGGTYQCVYGNSSSKIASDPIIVTVLQKFVGDGSNKRSKREYLSFSINERINWFKILTEDQQNQLLTQFEVSQSEINDLKQRGKIPSL